MQSEEWSKLQLIFSQICTKIFDAKKLLKRQREDTNYEELHKSLEDLVRESKETTNDHEIPYLMAALADEVFLNTDWEGKKYWESNMLEQIFFGTQTAGEAVFQRIDELLTSKSPEMAAKAQMYLKILALGFLGKYREVEKERKKISTIKQKLYDFIEHFDKTIYFSESRLFQAQYNRTLPTVNRQLLPDANNIIYLCLGLLFLFCVIGTMIWLVETQGLFRILSEISAMALKGNG